MSVSVVTLLVDPMEAERLTLASTEGKIQLALRNPLDKTAPPTPGIRPAALLGYAAPRPCAVARRWPRRRAMPPPGRTATVEIIRGDKRAARSRPSGVDRWNGRETIHAVAHIGAVIRLRSSGLDHAQCSHRSPATADRRPRRTAAAPAADEIGAPVPVSLLVGRSTVIDVGTPIARVSLTSADIADALVTLAESAPGERQDARHDLHVRVGARRRGHGGTRSPLSGTWPGCRRRSRRCSRGRRSRRTATAARSCCPASCQQGRRRRAPWTSPPDSSRSRRTSSRCCSCRRARAATRCCCVSASPRSAAAR